MKTHEFQKIKTMLQTMSFLLAFTSGLTLAQTNMVLIKGGYYTSLYGKSGTSGKEYVKSFYIDIHAVTNKQFLKFVKANPVWRRSKVKRIFADRSYLKNWKSDLNPGKNVNPFAPVTDVSWFAANAYCKWIGKRLPTLAEWELVAAGKAGRQNKTDFNNKLIAWYSSAMPGHLNSVRSTGKNVYGVFDMFGLIKEWTYDFSSMKISGSSVCSGGAVDATDLTNYPAFLRYGFRSSLKANSTVENLGFRCARDYK